MNGSGEWATQCLRGLAPGRKVLIELTGMGIGGVMGIGTTRDQNLRIGDFVESCEDGFVRRDRNTPDAIRIGVCAGFPDD